MKRKFDHSSKAPGASDGTPRPGASATGQRNRRSLDEQADTPGFREQMAREFPASATPH